jgi:Transglycosylase
LGLLAAGCLIVGIVGGFTVSADRQVRGGVLEQRAEAVRRPDWIALESLPGYVPDAFMVVVDPGYEEGGTLRARDERETTIPREIVRQIHLLDEGLVGDARELVMAPVLEQRASKSQLLELFLNRVYLGTARGAPVYGIYYAAEEYLGKRAEDLTLGEAATLAGLLLRPAIERPEERPGAVGVRRNEVLRALLQAGHIDEAAYRDAIAERLAFQPGLSERPMTRRMPTPADSVVIRLPPEYRTLPDSTEES